MNTNDFTRFGDFKVTERMFPDLEDRTVNAYGKPPVYLGRFNFDLPEVMYYLYLPVVMCGKTDEIRLPHNIKRCRKMVESALIDAPRTYKYAYISARKGWATPDNPLNRPGWHCDGFGSDDMNFVWWVGPGTRFAIQPFSDISSDHIHSLQQFERQITEETVVSYPERGLYALTPYVVHATPLIEAPGCMRQYVKISLSDHQYNLEDNSHNYLFDYDWPLNRREIVRNDTHAAQGDFSPSGEMLVKDDTPDAEFIDQCEITLQHGVALGDWSRLRLFRLAGHAEEPANRMIEWPIVWEMIADARKRITEGHPTNA